MKNLCLVLFCAVVSLSSAIAASNESPLLLQQPTLSAQSIAFTYGNALWRVDRAGGDAVRIAGSDTGTISGPKFSPDGTWIAFTGDFDGNQDVYLVAAQGGQLRRLKNHPSTDVALGWTPDGKRVLFRRYSLSDRRINRALRVA